MIAQPGHACLTARMVAVEGGRNDSLRRLPHWKGPRSFLAVGTFTLLSACSWRGGAVEPASRQGRDVLQLWRVLFGVGIAIGLLVTGLILWSVIRYRRPRGAGPNDLPAQTDANLTLEVMYTVLPLVLVAVLFVVSLGVQRRMTQGRAAPDIVVDVTGFQWGWRFGYPAQSISVVGDANRQPTLVLPVGADVRLRLVSADVIHSFFVPAFLVKRDLIPSVDNQIDVHPTALGRYRGFCAEFCGLDHWRMTFDVEVVTPDAFRAFLGAQRSLPPPPNPDVVHGAWASGPVGHR